MRWNPAPNNAFCTWMANLVNRWPPSATQPEALELHNAGYKRADEPDKMIDASAREP